MSYQLLSLDTRIDVYRSGVLLRGIGRSGPRIGSVNVSSDQSSDSAGGQFIISSQNDDSARSVSLDAHLWADDASLRHLWDLAMRSLPPIQFILRVRSIRRAESDALVWNLDELGDCVEIERANWHQNFSASPA